MPHKDLREFIAALDKSGDLQRIKKEVDWNLEAGAITRKCCEEVGPAVLFEKIKDYPDGYGVFCNVLASFRRLAIAIDMPPDSTFTEILDKYDEGRKNPIKPIIVSDGPCKEEILLGDDVDLYKFPSLIIHGGDGGRYLCTWHITITQDPDSGWTNWGMYRAMIHDKKRLGGLMLPQQHIGMIYAKYEEKGIPMPFAIAIAPEPVVTWIGTSCVPYGVSEVDVAGGVRGEPVSLVKCETNDLLVPASAEIVIEGEVPPYERMEEGPFGEYPGYQTSGISPKPVYHVKAITHRKNPILTASNMGMPVDDCDVAMSIALASDVRSELIRAGLPITGIYIPPESCIFTAIISTKTPYAGIANRIASCIWANKNGSFLTKVIVVEDGVDPTDMKQVFHAFSTAHHPIRGTSTLSPTVAHSLMPYLSEYDREHGIGANVVYDCTWPKDWSEDEIPKKASFRDLYPQEIQKRVLNNWREYGFKG
ncbi:MAG: UbiD family decarboxylase [Syntrophales bacterium]